MADQTMRWKFYDPVLLWLFPGTYVLHLLEEWVASAPVLLWRARLDRPLALWSFIAPNALALTLMILGVTLVRRSPRFHWIVPALATATLLNTAGHFVGSVASARYSAGLMTAVIFWMPLGLLTLFRVKDQASAKTFGGGIAVGVAVEIVVVATMAAFKS